MAALPREAGGCRQIALNPEVTEAIDTLPTQKILRMAWQKVTSLSSFFVVAPAVPL